MTMRFWKEIVIVLWLFEVGCKAKPKQPMSLTKQTSYYFEMNAARQTEFRGVLEDIEMGDDYQKIIARLGKPDYERALTTKQGRFVVKSLFYYFKRWAKDLVSEGKDQFVDLQLDANNHLMRIVSNVDGIPNREAQTH